MGLTMSHVGSKEDYWMHRALEADETAAFLIAALSEIESVSTDQHAVGIAKAALAKVEE